MSNEAIPKITTSWGEMSKLSKDDDQWACDTQVNGAELTIFVNDVNGAPNPQFLDVLSGIIEQLPILEQTARQVVSRVSANYQLGSISDVWPYRKREEMDFSIGFDYDEESWGESVFVDFKGQNVVSWSGAD